jgi:hypothetical protein
MENLIFKHKGAAITKRIVGGIFILFGITNFIFTDKIKPLGWIANILLIVCGVFYLTPWIGGSDRSSLEASEGSLRIRWRNLRGKVVIQDNEIEKIVLDKTAILIMRKDKKAKRLDIHEFEKDQKTKFYEFMIEYARQKNLPLERK